MENNLKKCIYLYVTESLCCTTVEQYCKSTEKLKKKKHFVGICVTGLNQRENTGNSESVNA